MGRPASRTIVRSPFSVSSFAAHPPEMPEPTTIASYVAVGMPSDGRSEGHAALIAVKEHPRLEDVHLYRHRREVPVHRERLQTSEREPGAGLVGPRRVERRHERRLLGRRQIDELRGADRGCPRVEIAKTGERHD